MQQGLKSVVLVADQNLAEPSALEQSVVKPLYLAFDLCHQMRDMYMW